MEASLESDESLAEGDVSKLFNLYLNTCPDQGSRTIRTEVHTDIYLFLRLDLLTLYILAPIFWINICITKFVRAKDHLR